jgi:GntR family transcriptional repressor for pyruvate dehydrogenase complex
VTDASAPYHAEIGAAIRARDPERARQAMIEHLSVASRFYGEDYETSLERLAQRHLSRLLEPGVTLDALLAGGNGR